MVGSVTCGCRALGMVGFLLGASRHGRLMMLAQAPALRQHRELSSAPRVLARLLTGAGARCEIVRDRTRGDGASVTSGAPLPPPHGLNIVDTQIPRSFRRCERRGGPADPLAGRCAMRASRSPLAGLGSVIGRQQMAIRCRYPEMLAEISAPRRGGRKTAGVWLGCRCRQPPNGLLRALWGPCRAMRLWTAPLCARKDLGELCSLCSVKGSVAQKWAAPSYVATDGRDRSRRPPRGGLAKTTVRPVRRGTWPLHKPTGPARPQCASSASCRAAARACYGHLHTHRWQETGVRVSALRMVRGVNVARNLWAVGQAATGTKKAPEPDALRPAAPQVREPAGSGLSSGCWKHRH